MFERDHIMRQVNQLAQALARAMSLRAENQQAEALSEIDSVIGQVAGVDVLGATEDELKARLGTSDDPLAVHGADIAALLAERGDAFNEMSFDAESARSYRMALVIYRHLAETGGESLPWDIHERMRRLERSIEARE
jgi:hypothetical protein